jgi:hypothetical protein
MKSAGREGFEPSLLMMRVQFSHSHIMMGVALNLIVQADSFNDPIKLPEKISETRSTTCRRTVIILQTETDILVLL